MPDEPEILDASYRLVVFAHECEPCPYCDDLICPVCDDHYAECACPGPTEDDVEYVEDCGVLFGRIKSN